MKGMIIIGKIDCSITENYLREKIRFTRSCKNRSCVECPFYHYNKGSKVCDGFDCLRNADESIAIIQRWSDAHPQKTYKDDFLEKFPDAEKKRVDFLLLDLVIYIKKFVVHVIVMPRVAIVINVGMK